VKLKITGSDDPLPLLEEPSGGEGKGRETFEKKKKTKATDPGTLYMARLKVQHLLKGGLWSSAKVTKW